MSVDVMEIVGPTRLARRRRSKGSGAATTSIRVSVPTHDALADEAKREGLTLGAYVEKMARRAEKERIFAEYRAAAEEAYKDPAFVEEMMEWEDMDDGIELDDDWSAGYDEGSQDK